MSGTPSFRVPHHLCQPFVTPSLLHAAESDYQELGRRTEGFSGSDVSVVVKDVLMQPIRLLREATHFRQTRRADGGELK